MLEQLKHPIAEILNGGEQCEAKLQQICDLLQESVPYYDWVGFYFKNGNKKELKLGPMRVPQRTTP